MSNITIDIQKCKGCKLCIKACPKNVLEPDTAIINDNGVYPIKLVKPDNCILCGCCAVMCPDCAILIEGN